MQQYVIQDYQKGFEEDQVRIGVEVARNWIWPYAYNLVDLLQRHAQPDFDPNTRHYCFLGTEMVGYIVSNVMPSGDNEMPTAHLDFPRMMPGHEQAAELLVYKAFETLKERSVSRVVGRVTTMCPDDIRLAERVGFSISDWGYKVYYSYEMKWGRLTPSRGVIEEVNPQTNLEAYAQIAARWYKRPPEWCRSLLVEWHEAGLITHLGVRENGKLVAACMAAHNAIQPTTAAVFYIYTPDEGCLKTLLARVVDKCIDRGVHNLIADLVNEHRQYESAYQELGFKKVADWARCEKALV